MFLLNIDNIIIGDPLKNNEPNIQQQSYKPSQNIIRLNPSRHTYLKISKLNLTSVPINSFGNEKPHTRCGFLIASKTKEFLLSQKKSQLSKRRSISFSRRPATRQMENPGLYEYVTKALGL
jgi:hypothetical protein